MFEGLLGLYPSAVFFVCAVMVVQPEKRLIWHPRLDNKFLVGGGSQVTLYEWVPDSSEIKHVTSKQDLNVMKVEQPLHLAQIIFTLKRSA